MALSQGIVGTANYSGGVQTQALGNQGDVLGSQLHGKWYSAAKAGRLFFGSTTSSGTAIPITSATSATFAIYNPAGSGVNVELVRYGCGITSNALVVGSIYVAFDRNLIVAPTGVTLASVFPALISSGGINQARLYTAATVVAMSASGPFIQMCSISSTAQSQAGTLTYDFDGQVLLAPGSIAQVVGNIAQAATVQSLVWAEWPV